MKLKVIRKLIWNRRLTRTQVKYYGIKYSHGYTDAINDILTDIHKINPNK